MRKRVALPRSSFRLAATAMFAVPAALAFLSFAPAGIAGAPNVKGKIAGQDKLLPDVYAEAAKPESRRWTWREPSPSVASQFRTLSASGADLDDLARKEYFLPSLFYRLGTYRLQLPPLRARGDDVVMLFRVFLSDESARLGRAPPSLSPPVWRRLKDHDWPGNIRELRSFAVNVALGLLDDRIAVAQVPISKSLKVATASFEALAIRAALERNRGDITATTAELDMPRKTLYDKLTRHAIDPADYRARS